MRMLLGRAILNNGFMDLSRRKHEFESTWKLQSMGDYTFFGRSREFLHGKLLNLSMRCFNFRAITLLACILIGAMASIDVERGNSPGYDWNSQINVNLTSR